MKYTIALLSACIAFVSIHAQPVKQIQSPGGDIRVTVDFNKSVSYTVHYKGQLLLASSGIDLELLTGVRLSSQFGRPKMQTRYVNDIIVSPVPEKRKNIPDQFNELTCKFQNGFSLVFRVYNDGVAYRIVTHFNDSIHVKNETVQFNFTDNHLLYFPEVIKRDHQDIFHTSFEEPYEVKPLDSVTAHQLAFTPVLVAPSRLPKIVITDADIEDYPGMFVTGTGTQSLLGKFAPYPAAEDTTKGEYSQIYVSARTGFLARTKGTRQFPWRVLMIAPEDKDLPANDLVYRLGSPSRIGDASWIRPGKATDEWIITENIFNVPFKSGINTNTYKYYIDFAKKFGFERIMMDAGWSDNNDLFKINPNINMDEIVAYAKSKGVALSMWTLAMTLDRQLEPALEQFKRWGVAFIMTDFIDRDDQKAVQLFYRIAEGCARHKIMLMFHGAFKPAGFNRTFPHAITREAVLGSEYNMWSRKASPEHNLLLPFIRMTAGPMDYEPGMLDNATPQSFSHTPGALKVMSLGTRCQQLAMYVIYESPIQFFAGNPSQGLMEPAFMQLLGSIPTVWDTTIVLDGRLGDYIITAREKDGDWFIGAMTDGEERTFEVPLDFLENAAYEATICEDGINADRYPSDYKLYEVVVTRKDTLKIKMAPGGGYLVRLRKK